MPRSSLLSLFDEFARFSRGVAIVQQRGYRREAWTYQKLTGAAVLRALQLKEHGVRSADRVLLWGPTPRNGWSPSGVGCCAARWLFPCMSSRRAILPPALPPMPVANLLLLPA